MQMLSRIGAPAAAAKRPLALSSPEIMVCIETSSSAGKVMRVSVTARVVALGVACEARREQPDHLGREEEREREQHDVDGEQRRGDLVGEAPRRRLAVLLERAGIGRHEGGVEGAFGENGAEMVGQAEGDEEGVGDGAGAENGGHDHVADEAREARDERQPADGGDAPNHALSRALMVPPRWRQRGK